MGCQEGVKRERKSSNYNHVMPDKDIEREYCPICESHLYEEIPGVVWVVVHHSACLKPILEKETKVLSIMEKVARQSDVLNALIDINAAIAGNSRRR